MTNPGRDRMPPLDVIVRELYGALSEQLTFDHTLRSIGQVFRSHITALHAVDLAAGHAWLEMAVGVDPREYGDISDAYATQWSGQNLWIERGLPALLGKGLGVGEDVVSEHELVHTEYFRHFLRPLDIHVGLGINVLSDGCSRLSICSLNRSRHEGSFQRDELQLIEQLRPHLVNAYSICRRLGALQDATHSLRDALTHAPIGILVLDADGRIVEKNGEAERLLACDAGIACAPDQTLRLARHAARVALKGVLARLASSPAPLPECIVIGKGGEQITGSLVLHLCTFPTSASHSRDRNGAILGFLCEINRHCEAQIAVRLLRVALDLTPMESVVVLSLRDHHDPLRVAEELDLAISTVRSHLKHAFRKTGTSRQSELLQVVDRVLSAAPC